MLGNAEDINEFYDIFNLSNTLSLLKTHDKIHLDFDNKVQLKHKLKSKKKMYYLTVNIS